VKPQRAWLLIDPYGRVLATDERLPVYWALKIAKQTGWAVERVLIVPDPPKKRGGGR
jgi:hypothetical protein